MAITVREQAKSRDLSQEFDYTGGDGTYTRARKYDIWLSGGPGVDPLHEDVAAAYLLDNAPNVLGFLPDGRLMIMQSFNVEAQGRYAYVGTVNYGPLSLSGGKGEDPENGTNKRSFSVTAETLKIKLSYETMQHVFDPAKVTKAVDYHGFIGVDNKGHVEGVDIVEPRLRFSETWNFNQNFITPAWVKTAASIVGTVSAYPFRTFAVGEIMLVGLEGGLNEEKGKYELQFTFDTAPNQENFQLTDNLTVDKRGFDHVWVAFEQEDDSASLKIVPRPVTANVERVYRYVDYSPLGIGD